MSGTNLLPVAAPASPATSSLTPEPTPVDVNGATATQALKKESPPLQAHYNELLRLIGDIGRDVKPAYTISKVSTDKLRKNIMMARTVIRECQADLEKLARD